MISSGWTTASRSGGRDVVAEGRRGYDILPRTWKSRALLGLAFAIGLAGVIAGVIAPKLAPDTHQHSIDFTVENRTGGEVTVLLDRWPWGTVLFEEDEFTTYGWEGRQLVQVVDERGLIVYSERLSYGELEDMGFRIVVDGE